MQGHRTGAALAASTLVDVLAMRAAERPDEVLYRFVDDDGRETCWTYSELERAGFRVAALLEELSLTGEPVLLLYPPGLEYIAAFFGCLYSGAIAVPAYPPRPGRMMRRLETILADSGARVALTTDHVRRGLDSAIADSPLLRSVVWRSTDQAESDPLTFDRPRAVGPDALAFLQYTSGSTGEPKGVMVSHANLLHNLSTIYQAFDSSETVAVSWLPMYHDMGLIGGILGTIYSGGQNTLYSPMRFLQRPLAWLQHISNRRITHSGAPNFAYDLCVERTSPAERQGLDLSSWRVAFTGAETIRSETLARFAEAFAPCGFRADSFFPCYGLAEATLMVTSRTAADSVSRFKVSRTALEQGRAVPVAADEDALTLVGSGVIVGGQDVRIVDPETCRVCPPGRVGEIWIQGPSVTRGYWNRDALSAQVFGARLADDDAGPYLRSGDLGFMQQGQLFVTGRIKDVIIIRGRNHYPQDIEFTAQTSHPALQPNGGAAFTLSDNGPERVALVLEVRREAVRKLDAAAVIAAARQAVLEEYDLRLDAVGLVRPGSISRTTSGKIERYHCRQRYRDGDFEFIELWTAPAGASPSPSAAPLSHNTNGTGPLKRTDASDPATELPVAAALVPWIARWLTQRLELPPDSVDPRQPLSHYGLDSLMAVELLHDFERQFGREFDVGTLVDAPSIEALAARMASAEDDPAWSLWAHDTSDALLPGIARPTWRGPWGDRADGIRVRGESPMREMMPYLMRGRNESVAYHDATYDITRTTQWLEQYNRQHPDRRATLFDPFSLGSLLRGSHAAGHQPIYFRPAPVPAAGREHLVRRQETVRRRGSISHHQTRLSRPAGAVQFERRANCRRH